MNRSKEILAAVVAVTLLIGFGGGASAAELDGPVSIVYDSYGVPTVVATTEHDAVYMQGYLHAKDRLFQMDFLRHVFQGRVAEMVGSGGLAQDVQLRTLGVRRAAERSMPVQTPGVLAWLQAYSDGVNAYLADTSIPLPIEYYALEIDRSGIEPWTPLDSLTMAKGLAWDLSFGLEDIDRTLAILTFRPVCDILGCNGLQLANDDLYPTAPFEGVVSIPPNPPPPLAPGEEPPSGEPPAGEQLPAFMSDPNFQTLTQNYRDAIADIPILERALENDQTAQGSNWWVVSGALTESGFPMLANDPHLSLGSPATFYEVHLYVAGGMNVTGVSFPGAPGIVQGCNDEICWGSTVNSQDVTDVYQEVLIATNPAAPTSPTHTYWGGALEPIQFIPQQFFFNIVGDGTPNNTVNAGIPATSGGVTMVVPRRLNGPIVQVIYNPSSSTPLIGLSVMYAGWEPTQELEAFRQMARAGSMDDFKAALQYFDVGSQNWSYADIHGNIAYYTSGEVPIREDLQQLFFPAGLQPPGLIRDGSHTNPHEWMPLTNPQPNQALSTEILPFAEMPQIENPAAGYVVNANNDPIGTTFDNVAWNSFRAGFNGRLYLSSQYAAGYRQGRLQRLLNGLFAGGGKMSVAESIATQANNQLLDAEILTPFLLDAYANATAPGAAAELTAIVSDPRIGDAIGRLSSWDFSTPTGINQGFDPGDNPAAPGPPSAAEVDASVAATIYSLWRGQTVQRVVDSTLANLPIPLDAYAPGSAQAMTAVRKLLENYPINGGTGVSLINFFNVPGVADQDVARDIVLLESLRDALDLAASDEFAPAFNNSTNLDDYRWGYLHRIVFSHYLGGPFSVPPPGSPLNVAPDLPGVSRAGGMGSVDAASHSARADGLNEFMFGSGPSRRLIATMEPTGPVVLEVIPGGESGQPGNPMGIDQLFLWLVNAFKPLPVSLADVNALAVNTDTYVCGDGVVGPGEQCDDANTDDADGCNQACVVVPAITCQAPVAVADPQTCDASIACSAIASCVDPLGGAVTASCAPAGPYGIGTTAVTVQCVGAQTSARVCSATVEDQAPPVIDVTLDPDSLWPPNHRMVDILADVQAADSCSAASVTLDSVTSNEPDNGDNDGNTTNDIQGVDVGTADFAFQLRAERQGSGLGRTYTVTYTATDASGNSVSDSATVTVAKDRDGVTEPLMLSLGKKPAGSYVSWSETEVGATYTVIRGDLDDLVAQQNVFELKELTCLDVDIAQTQSTYEDPNVPASGGVFYYLVEYNQGGMRSSFGTVSAEKPRHPAGTYCE